MSAGLKTTVDPGIGPGFRFVTVETSPGANARVSEVMVGPTRPQPSVPLISGNAT